MTKYEKDIYEALTNAINYAIDTMGIEEFRKTSFFMSNRK